MTKEKQLKVNDNYSVGKSFKTIWLRKTKVVQQKLEWLKYISQNIDNNLKEVTEKLVRIKQPKSCH